MSELERPLRSTHDCEALHVGEKSVDKLKEIVSTGGLRRNEARLLPHTKEASWTSTNMMQCSPHDLWRVKSHVSCVAAGLKLCPAWCPKQALAQDPQRQAVKLFSAIWGTGETTAERWWLEGCRSLDDIAQREDLTKQQVHNSLWPATLL